jgi:hypothetical protein
MTMYYDDALLEVFPDEIQARLETRERFAGTCPPTSAARTLSS